MACGLATALLLGVGSIVLAVTRRGASAEVGMDDVRAFFLAPSPVHAWFYGLCVVLALYAVNTTLATWRSVARKWRAGVRAPRFYAAAFMHVAFLTALVAHLVGGLGGEEMGQVLVGPNWIPLGDGGEVRVTAVDTGRHPDGSAKQVTAWMERRWPDGRVVETTVRYNGPLFADLGRDVFLLARAGEMPVGHFGRGKERCAVGRGESCRLGDVQMAVMALEDSGGPHGAVARVQVKAGEGSRTLWLFAGRPGDLGDGTVLTLGRIERRPAVLLRHRRAPGNPWALLAGVLLGVGVLLMWRRLVSPPRAGG